MKIVVNTDQVAHLWANQSQHTARNGQGNFYFNGRAIYSYRNSWLLAVMTDKRDESGARLVIANSLTYGNTTSRHYSRMRGALRGLPFRVIKVESQLTDGDAEAILAGDIRTLSRLAITCGNEMRAEFDIALKKRDDGRARWHLKKARAQFADALAIIGMIDDKKARAVARKTLGNLPAGFPENIESPELMAELAELGKADRKARAVSIFDSAVKEARQAWKDARTFESAGTRAARCSNAIAKLQTAASYAKRADKKMPANLVKLADAKAYLAKLAPLQLAEDITRNERNLKEARGYALDNYYSSVRQLRAGYSLAPNRVRLALADIHGARSVAKVVAACHRVVNRSHADPFKPGAETHADKRVRAAYAAILATARDTLAELSPIAARIERMGNRAAIEQAQTMANDSARNANGCTALYAAIVNIELADKMRADNPELSRGLRVLYHPSDLAGLKKAHAISRYDDRLSALKGVHAGLIDHASKATASDATRAYAAVRSADLARENFESMRSILSELGQMRADGDIPVCDYIASLVGKESEFSGLVTAAHAHAASLEVDAVTAWRNRDVHAPRPAGTYFRLTADGNNIESSRGANVSILAGSRLWRMIRAAVDSGVSKAWPYNEGPAVGAFRVMNINADGSAIVGCHTITATEARAFAQFMQWPPFGERVECGE